MPHEIPLVGACESGSTVCVELLLAAGAEVAVRDSMQRTPLWYAMTPEIARLLLERGLSLTDTDFIGWTPLARGLEDPRRARELGYNAWHAAVDVNGIANEPGSVRATFRYLEELGVDIEHRNDAGLTPLGRAILEGTAAEVEGLLEVGADPNALLGTRYP